MTSRIEQQLDYDLILFLWSLIEDARKSVNLDYLQILNLSRIEKKDEKSILQGIYQTQEQPPYSRNYVIPITGQLIVDRIYIIDEPDYSVMLFAGEY